MSEGLFIALVVIIVEFVASLLLYTQTRDQHDEVVRLINLLATFIGEQKKS